MTTLIKDIIQSSLSNFASQFKSDNRGKGESSQDHETSRDRLPSPNHVDHSEGEEGELASDEEDPEINQGDPNLDQLMLTEEEQKHFESFALALPSLSVQKGKINPLWKVSQENTKFYSQAQQAHQQTNPTFTSQAQPIRYQAQAQVAQVPIQAEAQAQVQIQAQSQPAQAEQQAPAQLAPAPLPVLVRHGDQDPFAEDDRYSPDLQDEASLYSP